MAKKEGKNKKAKIDLGRTISKPSKNLKSKSSKTKK
jgi:hypothetical protein